MEENKLEEVCNELGIEMTIGPNCYIESSRDERFSNILADKNVNIDELNYLMKRFDGFSPREIEKFYAVAFAEETKSMAVASKELDELDGESYAMDVIENNKSARVTPYGVLYRNANQPEQVYDGKHFPPYGWEESVTTLERLRKYISML